MRDFQKIIEIISGKENVLFFILCVFCFSDCSTNNNSNAENDNILISSQIDLSKFLSSKALVYTIDPTKDTLLKCKKGTILYLQANSLQLPDGSIPSKPLRMEISEWYELSELIGGNLETRSGDKILETAGMLDINVTSDGMPVSMKEGKEYAIAFPKKAQKSNMELFYGYSKEDGSNDWIQASPVSKSLIDQQAFSCKIRINGYTSGINKTEVKWKMKNMDQTIFDYFQDSFSAPKKMEDDFCTKGYRVKLRITLNAIGKVSKVDIDSSSTLKYDKIISDFLYSMAPVDIKSMGEFTPEQDYELDFSADEMIDNNAYNSRFTEKYSSFKNSAISKIDANELNCYVQTATKFGWINCDRFWDTQNEKIDYSVKTGFPQNTKIVILFKGIKSIMNGYVKDDRIVFSNIPINQEIKIIGISYISGKPTMAIAETKTDKKGFELKDFKQFTLTQLTEQLNKIN